MNRSIQYTGQIPLETDPLGIQRNTMIAIGKLSQAMLGDGPVINGFDCTPTAPASMDVTISPGEIYDLSAIDATDYSSLLADTDHNILKQGIELDPTTLTITPPTTSGFSRKYLVQIAFSEVDAGATVLPYYNSADPAHGWSGPGNTGAAQYTQRNGTCVVQLKAGVAAATGSETAPAVDPGFAPAWIITVDEGDTEINSGDIVRHPDAPIIPTRLPYIVSGGGGGGSVDPATTVPRVPSGSGAVGSSLKYMRADAVIPSDPLKANLASPALSGTPTAPTPPTGTNSTRIATTAFVRSQILSSAPNLTPYALIAGTNFSGAVTVLDRPDNDNNNNAANTRYVDSAISAIHAPTRHVYNAAGAYSPAVPTWAKSVRYKSWGAGAGALMVSGGEGAGGSAGGYRHGILDVTAGGSIDINVGAGGTGHAADSNGPDAGDTVITYGTTTITAGGAQGGQYSGGAANPGNPGTGDVNGQQGGNPYNPNKMLCEGGSAPFGGAGGIVNNGSGAAISGRWPGGGGGNGYNLSGNVPGDGADGGVIIEFWPI